MTPETMPSLSGRSPWRRLIIPALKGGATYYAEVAASATKVELWHGLVNVNKNYGSLAIFMLAVAVDSCKFLSV